MKFKNFPTWLKGGIIGGVIGLALTILFIFIDGIPSNLLRFVLSNFVIVVLPFIFLGVFIGFLSSFVKVKKNPIFIGGILGMIIGIFGFFFIETIFAYLFLFPIFLFGKLNEIFNIISIGHESVILGFLINILSWVFTGMLIGLIAYLVKKRRSEVIK